MRSFLLGEGGAGKRFFLDLLPLSLRATTEAVAANIDPDALKGLSGLVNSWQNVMSIFSSDSNSVIDGFLSEGLAYTPPTPVSAAAFVALPKRLVDLSTTLEEDAVKLFGDTPSVRVSRDQEHTEQIRAALARSKGHDVLEKSLFFLQSFFTPSVHAALAVLNSAEEFKEVLFAVGEAERQARGPDWAASAVTQ